MVKQSYLKLTDMVYRASADTKIRIGGWPQFFHTCFLVYAKSDSDARMQAEQALKCAPVTYKEILIEFLGRQYKVSSNEEFSVAGVRYPEGTVRDVCIFEDTMQICIDCIRNGHPDHDNIGVWDIPVRFRDEVNRVLSKMEYKEI